MQPLGWTCPSSIKPLNARRLPLGASAEEFNIEVHRLVVSTKGMVGAVRAVAALRREA